MINKAPATIMARHSQLGISEERLVDIYTKMLLARKFDERGLLLQRSGKIAFHVSGIGQETGQVAAAFALDLDKDYFLPYYRDYAFVLSVGMTVKELMLSIFAKAEDPNSGGRQMPGHFGCKRLRIVTGSSPVATQIPHAVGVALAGKMKKQDFVSFVSFGDGSSNQGDFHEGINFAAVHQLPVIFFCENNLYAISTPASKQFGNARIVDRAIGYGIPGIRVDGNDVFEVYEAVKTARERAANGEGPTLIEAMMYRVSPHSTADDDLLYRTKEEVEMHIERDGIVKLKSYLIEHGIWSEEQDKQLLERVKEEINEATKYADHAAPPAPEDTLLYVYDEDQ